MLQDFAIIIIQRYVIHQRNTPCNVLDKTYTYFSEYTTFFLKFNNWNLEVKDQFKGRDLQKYANRKTM